MLRNTRRLYPGQPHGSPFYVFDGGSLVPDRQTLLTQPLDSKRLQRSGYLADWMNKSRLLSLLHQAWANTPDIVARIKMLVRPKRPTQSVSKAIPADYLSTWPYTPEIPEMRESWMIGDAFFQMMKADCDRHSAEFWIATIGMETCGQS